MHTVTGFLNVGDGVRPAAIAVAKSRRGEEREREPRERELLAERKERVWMAAKGPTRGQPWLPGEYCTTVHVILHGLCGCALYMYACIWIYVYVHMLCKCTME
ncbi:hypothetical protein RHMOL_Rhmol09G0112100 [Rhododendron molle]|uniref:Uncharacterized protein n=1 Tax=Rhododendron molle TaxID=49168 RepID=A0ACC0MCR9_RHOML|nr:hypothetical protein RHMOL_Rhmol09G0112100 [Rhododendron molle]